MALTISSVTTMCLLSSLLVLLLCLLLKSDAVLRKIGPKCLLALLFVVLIRMLLPFEFSYTYSVRVEDLLSPFRMLLKYSILTDPFELTVWQLLVFLWASGGILLAARKLYTYRKVNRLLSLLPEEKWEQFCEKYEINPEEFHIVRKIKVVHCKQFRTPCLVGFKQCYLVLPEEKYKKEQLRYIILHEMLHAENRDIGWKLCMDWLCTVFWWNPVFWYLKKEIFQLIEMRNDIRVADTLSEKERIGYMKCLKEMAVRLAKKDLAFGVAFSRNDLRALKRRIKLIAGYKSFNRGQQILVSLLIGMVLFATSMIILEPYSLKNIEGEGVPLTSDNSYLIRNGEAFDVYVNGKYIMTVGDSHSFINVKIYNNIKEAQENE